MKRISSDTISLDDEMRGKIIKEVRVVNSRSFGFYVEVTLTNDRWLYADKDQVAFINSRTGEDIIKLEIDEENQITITTEKE